MNITLLNEILEFSGSNLYVFEDPYNDHKITINCHVSRRGFDVTLAKTQLTTAETAQCYIDRNQDSLAAQAKRWGGNLTRAEDDAECAERE